LSTPVCGLTLETLTLTREPTPGLNTRFLTASMWPRSLSSSQAANTSVPVARFCKRFTRSTVAAYRSPPPTPPAATTCRRTCSRTQKRSDELRRNRVMRQALRVASVAGRRQGRLAGGEGGEEGRGQPLESLDGGEALGDVGHEQAEVLGRVGGRGGGERGLDDAVQDEVRVAADGRGDLRVAVEPEPVVRRRHGHRDRRARQQHLLVVARVVLGLRVRDPQRRDLGRGDLSQRPGARHPAPPA